MEAIGFILQQFYYYFAAGFVINVFIMANVFAWSWHTQNLDCVLRVLSNNNGAFIFIFIVSAIIISIIIVGFNELVFQINKKLGDNSILKSLFDVWLLKGTHWRSAVRLDEEKDPIMVKFTNVFFDKIRKLDNVNGEGQPYHNVFVGAKIIEMREKSYDIYRFRDLSYLCQYMSTSVLFTFLCSLGLLIYFGVNGRDEMMLWFYGSCAIISFVMFLLLPEIAKRFADRFIRVVGKTYTAHVLKDKLFSEDNK